MFLENIKKISRARDVSRGFRHEEILWGFLAVFKRYLYIILIIVLSLLFFLIFTYLQNFYLLRELINLDFLTTAAKLNITWKLIGGSITNSTIPSFIVTILLSILSGINISFLTFLLRQSKKMSQKRSSTSSFWSVFFGGFLGFLGAGCVACGSFFALSLFSFFGIGGLLTLLPLHGVEIGMLGIVLLFWSTMSIARKISKPLTCSIQE